MLPQTSGASLQGGTGTFQAGGTQPQAMSRTPIQLTGVQFAQTPSVQAQPNAAATSNVGTGTSTGANAAQINNVYDTSSNYYKGLLNTIAPQQQVDQGATDRQYNDNLTSLTHQRDAAYANLDNQTNNLNQSYTRSLQQLGNQIRNTYQGQQNALGTQGAGDSSAAGQLGYALGQQQNQSRGYMNQDLNQQLNQVGLSRKAEDTGFQDQAQQLNDWKTSQYQNIAKQYAQLQQQIGTQLANNEQARKNALMYAGQWAQGQVANIDTQLQQNLANVSQAYQGASAPKVDLGNIPQYQAQNIVAPTIPVQGALSQPAQQNLNQPTQIYSPYKQDQNLGY